MLLFSCALFLVSSCGGPEEDLADLSGLTLISRSGDGTATFELSPSFSDTVSRPCPMVGEVRFNNVVLGTQAGGVETSGLFGQDTSCGTFYASVDEADSVDGGDLLTIAGATGVASLRAEGLVAQRRFVPVNGTTIERGGALRFRYESTNDTALTLTASDACCGAASDLSFTVNNNEIQVQFPQDFTGGYLGLKAEFEVPVLACEGFLACDTRSVHVDSFEISLAE